MGTACAAMLFQLRSFAWSDVCVALVLNSDKPGNEEDDEDLANRFQLFDGLKLMRL